MATDTRIDVQSVPTCTTLTTTMNTLYNFLLPKLLGYSANTSGSKIVITWLYAFQATKTFVTRLQFNKKGNDLSLNPR